ncbi:MAG: hypothetical protein DBY30_03880 [Verrucomicrobia bacterium]|nr:MAG: hypothetical protein DBY30_03880 [Verrucomicrobiota bacterium]
MRATVNIGICGGGRPRNFAAIPRVYFLQTLASLSPKKYRFSRCRRAGRKPVCPLKGARCVFFDKFGRRGSRGRPKHSSPRAEG